MQFEFDPSEVICFKCGYFIKGLAHDETSLRMPHCNYFDSDFGQYFKFKNNCAGFSSTIKVILPTVRKLRE